MRLSTRARYGLRLMVDLAVYDDRGPITASSIAKRQQISQSYADQLLFRLRRAGLVKSVRGPGGGFLLARKPDQTTALDVVIALQESVSPVFCVDQNQTKARCERVDSCATRKLWGRLKESIEDILRDTTLADLSADAAELCPKSDIEHSYTFQI